MDKNQNPLEPNYHKENLVETQEVKKTAFFAAIASFFNFFGSIILIILIAAGIRYFLIQPFLVEGQSMEPTFHNNDYLITEKVSFKFRQPRRGEVIIFHPQDSPSVSYIKRIIGLPGDTISLKDGTVLVNGQKIDEPYLKYNEQTIPPSDSNKEYVLGGDQFFVLGDNRAHSRDSRELGPIQFDSIVSRTWVRLYPLASIKAFAAVNYSPAAVK